jgi:hypothetical protein
MTLSQSLLTAWTRCSGAPADAGRALDEEWRDVADYEGLYEVSSFGRFRNASGQILSTVSKDKDGYPLISMSRAGKRRSFYLHRLVCRAFWGPRPVPGHETAHLDGVRTNCRADNLAWVSRVENHSHKRAHGTLLLGERHPRAKLSDAQVRELRQRAAAGEKISPMARRMGVHESTARAAVAGKNWRHLIPGAECRVSNERN